jgi:transposase
MSRKTYTKEFKQEAADYVISTGLPIAHVARELEIGEQMLGRWVKARRPNAQEAFSPKDDIERTAEIKSLKNRVEELEEELAILKKAAAFFAKARQ